MQDKFHLKQNMYCPGVISLLQILCLLQLVKVKTKEQGFIAELTCCVKGSEATRMLGLRSCEKSEGVDRGVKGGF